MLRELQMRMQNLKVVYQESQELQDWKDKFERMQQEMMSTQVCHQPEMLDTIFRPVQQSVIMLRALLTLNFTNRKTSKAQSNPCRMTPKISPA
jgi:uncharacterized membrane protein (DUF106 family)